MRPLNRPMFRYGGPIKEGIMNGMKEKQAINTVGNNANRDAMGREKHAFFLPFMGLAGQAARMALAPIGRFAMKQIAKRGVTSPGSGLIRSGLGRTRPMTSADSLTTEAMKFKPTGFGKYLLGSPEAKAIGAVASGSGRIGGAIKKVGSSLAKSPLTVGFLGYQGLKALGPDGKPVEGAEDTTNEIKRVDTIGAGEGTTGGSVAEDPNKAKQIQEDRIAKTKKRYYELMGIDKMKKDAAYDSLIDASKIVQQEGADLKGAIKSGSIQNQIISAISKNLDKSADIKRQIDAAILKGEIQKDVASADSLDRDLKKARIKTLERGEKQASASGQIAAIMAKSDGVILGSQTAAILRNDNIKYDGILQDKLFNNFKKDNPAADEIDFMIAKGKDLDDGRYVIGARLVEKKGNEVAFIV
jgi:ribosomal protein L18